MTAPTSNTTRLAIRPGNSRLSVLPREILMEIVEHLVANPDGSIGINQLPEITSLISTCRELYNAGIRVLRYYTPLYFPEPLGPSIPRASDAPQKQKAQAARIVYGKHLRHAVIDVRAMYTVRYHDDDWSQIERQLDLPWLHPGLGLACATEYWHPASGLTMKRGCVTVENYKQQVLKKLSWPVMQGRRLKHVFYPLNQCHNFGWLDYIGITSIDTLTLNLRGIDTRTYITWYPLEITAVIAAVIAYRPKAAKIRLVGLGVFREGVENEWKHIPVTFPISPRVVFRNHPLYDSLRTYPFKKPMTVVPITPGTMGYASPTVGNMFGVRSQYEWKRKVWAAVFERHQWEFWE